MTNQTSPDQSKAFIMCVGLPGTGKTTFCMNMIEKFKIDMQPCVYASSDHYIEKFTKRFNQPYVDVYPKFIKDAENFMMGDIRCAVIGGIPIIHDGLNITVKRRRDILDAIPATYHKIALLFDVPFDQTDEWRDEVLNHEFKPLNQKTLGELQSMYVEPVVEEGFDHVVDVAHSVRIMK